MRIGDILKLKWEQLMDQEFITIKEHKTGKPRQIKISEQLRDIIIACKPRYVTKGIVFRGRRDKKLAIDISTVNKMLKNILKNYCIPYTGNTSSHMLRKTFGRRVWEAYGESDGALILLSQIFNHSNIQTTVRYLGIQQEEYNEVYMRI